MTKDEQVFYVQYRTNDGYLTTLKDQNGFDNLSDNDQKSYQQVIVDQSHLSGWGRYWPTVRYVNGALSYPDNWPKDQTEQINDLSNQIKAANQNVNQLKSQLTDANKQIDQSANKIKELGQLDMQLQMQLAKANVKPQATKQNGGNK